MTSPSTLVNFSVTSTTRERSLIITEFCIFIFINIMAVFGNVLVCLAFYRSHSLRTITNYFILSLALSDLSMAIFVMPLKSASTLANQWLAGFIGCKVEYFFVNISAGVSPLTVMLLAVNRYFRVGQPKLYAVVFSSRRSITMAASAWILTIAVTIMNALVSELRFKTTTVLPNCCIQVYPSYTVSILSVILQSIYIAIPSFIIILCYLKIYKAIRLYNKKSATALQRRRASAYGVEETKITQVLTVVVVGFYTCWLPVLVTNILNCSQVIGKTELKYTNFFITIPMFTSCIINPIIYATMNQAFRREFKKIFQLFSCATAKFELV